MTKVSVSRQPQLLAQRVTGDQTTTLDTAVDVTNMSFPIGSNETWSFTFNILNGCNNTGGLKWSINGPAGSTLRAFAEGLSTASTARISAVITALDTLTAVAFNGVSSANGFTIISGTIVNGATTGTVQLRYASTTATQTSTVFANSSLLARRINPL